MKKLILSLCISLCFTLYSASFAQETMNVELSNGTEITVSEDQIVKMLEVMMDLTGKTELQEAIVRADWVVANQAVLFQKIFEIDESLKGSLKGLFTAEQSDVIEKIAELVEQTQNLIAIESLESNQTSTLKERFANYNTSKISEISDLTKQRDNLNADIEKVKGWIKNKEEVNCAQEDNLKSLCTDVETMIGESVELEELEGNIDTLSSKNEPESCSYKDPALQTICQRQTSYLSITQSLKSFPYAEIEKPTNFEEEEVKNTTIKIIKELSKVKEENAIAIGASTLIEDITTAVVESTDNAIQTKIRPYQTALKKIYNFFSSDDLNEGGPASVATQLISQMEEILKPYEFQEDQEDQEDQAALTKVKAKLSEFKNEIDQLEAFKEQVAATLNLEDQALSEEYSKQVIDTLSASVLNTATLNAQTTTIDSFIDDTELNCQNLASSLQTICKRLRAYDTIKQTVEVFPLSPYDTILEETETIDPTAVLVIKELSKIKDLVDSSTKISQINENLIKKMDTQTIEQFSKYVDDLLTRTAGLGSNCDDFKDRDNAFELCQKLLSYGSIEEKIGELGEINLATPEEISSTVGTLISEILEIKTMLKDNDSRTILDDFSKIGEILNERINANYVDLGSNLQTFTKELSTPDLAKVYEFRIDSPKNLKAKIINVAGAGKPHLCLFKNKKATKTCDDQQSSLDEELEAGTYQILASIWLKYEDWENKFKLSVQLE